MIILSSIFNNDLKMENYVSFEATVSNIYHDDESERTIIETSNQDKTFFISDSFTPYVDTFGLFGIDEDYTFIVTKSDVDDNPAAILEMRKKGEDGKMLIVYSCIDEKIENAHICGYFGIGSAVVGALLTTLYLYIKRHLGPGEASMAEYFFLVSYSAYVTRKAPHPVGKKAFLPLTFLILGVLNGIAAGIIVSIFENEEWAPVVLAILGVSAILMWVIGFLLIVPLFRYAKKDVPLFAKHYREFLNNENVTSLVSPFEKDGFRVEDEVLVPYDQATFIPVVQFRRIFNSCNIYLLCEGVSEFSPYIIPLDPDSYRNIKKYGVKVEGLDDIIANLEGEIEKYLAKKPVVVTYRKDAIDVHPLKLRNEDIAIYKGQR